MNKHAEEEQKQEKKLRGEAVSEEGRYHVAARKGKKCSAYSTQFVRVTCIHLSTVNPTVNTFKQ